MRSHELAHRVLSALAAVILVAGGWLGAVRPAYAVSNFDYDGGTGITNKLIQSDDTPNCTSTAPKGWIKVSTNGETIEVRLKSVNALAQAFFSVKYGGATVDRTLKAGEGARYGTLRLYVNSVFYGTQCYGAKITLGYYNTLPVAKFSISPNPAKVGQTVSFIDQSWDPDGTLTAWKWTFGDGGTSTSQSPTHVYNAAGTYDISLTVTDDKGESHTAYGSAVMNDPYIPVRGDANMNGRVDTGDATLILRNIVGLPIDPAYMPLLPRVDMNCNDRVDTGDATLVLRIVVGLPIPRCWETVRTLQVNP